MKMHVRQKKRTSVIEMFFQATIVFFAILNLFPLYWLISNTFKYSHEITRMPPLWFPTRISFDAYIDIFTSTSAARWLLNSLFVSGASTLLVVLISAMAAYSFAKLQFTGRNFLFAFFIGTLMIPKESYIIPLFTFMRDLKLINTYPSMILPVVALPFGVFLLKSFFESIPDAIRESGKIDGASEWKIFTSVILPMASAGIGSLFILMFVRCWNDYLWQLLMSKTDEMKTLMVGITSLMEDNRPDMARKLTGASISAIPMIIVFLVFQKNFTRGIAVGAVKG